MIAEKAKEAIELAINFEHNNITTKYGDKYASKHEAYAVLKKEIEDAADDLDQLNKDLAYLWALIKNNHIKKGNETISEAKDYAEMLAWKAVQVAAVCERFLDTIK